MRVRQHHATVGLLGGHAELVDHAAIAGRQERSQVEPRLQFGEMLAPSFRPLCILRPHRRLDVQLSMRCISKAAGGSPSGGNAKPGRRR